MTISPDDPIIKGILEDIEDLKQLYKDPEYSETLEEERIASRVLGDRESMAEWLRERYPSGDVYYNIIEGSWYPGEGTNLAEISLSSAMCFWEIAVLIEQENFSLDDFCSKVVFCSLDLDDSIQHALNQVYYFKLKEDLEDHMSCTGIVSGV